MRRNEFVKARQKFEEERLLDRYACAASQLLTRLPRKQVEPVIGTSLYQRLIEDIQAGQEN